MLWRFPLLLLVLTPAVSMACQCLVKYPMCSEVQHSNVVFAGTVESVAPAFLDRWKHDALPSDEIARLQADKSAAGFERLKSLYVKLLAGIPAAEILKVERAVTPETLRIAFEVVSGQRLTRFRVRTMFAMHDDDDDDPKPAVKKDDDDQVPEFLDVWTDAGDCGIDFQTGETYVVYAGVEEISKRLQTGICSRTRRLTDAGSDLSFLYYLKETPDEAIRIEGFVTSKLWDQYKASYEDRVGWPVSGMAVEIERGGNRRAMSTNAEGRFIFDGLAPGDYQLSVYAGEPLRAGALLSGPRTVHAVANACPAQPVMLVFPK